MLTLHLTAPLAQPAEVAKVRAAVCKALGIDEIYVKAEVKSGTRQLPTALLSNLADVHDAIADHGWIGGVQMAWAENHACSFNQAATQIAEAVGIKRRQFYNWRAAKALPTGNKTNTQAVAEFRRIAQQLGIDEPTEN